jgi:hypothetical protein
MQLSPQNSYEMGPANNSVRRVDNRNRGHLCGGNRNRPGIRISERQDKKKDALMSYQTAARDYIERLIHLQRHVPRQYKRIDQGFVNESITKLENQLSFFPYKEESQMIRFWQKYRYNIRILLPTNRHPAFAKLLVEFELLDSFASADKENQVWQAVSTALSKF